MKFSVAAITLALATAVAAAPGYGKHHDTTTVVTSENVCGQNTLRCCNKETKKVGSNNGQYGGLVSLLNGANLEQIGLFDQCSELTAQVPIIGAALGNFLNEKCKATAACCQDNESKVNGLIAVNAPCVPVNVLS